MVKPLAIDKYELRDYKTATVTGKTAMFIILRQIIIVVPHTLERKSR
jgi:hypothetical protein